MAITITELRANLYRLLDRIIDEGTPLEVQRRGRTVLITASARTSKFDALVKRPDVIRGDPDELIHHDWSGEWNPL